MMLDPALRTFLVVAEQGSLTRAAQQLYLSPTAVKKQMDALERSLGLTLLVRTPRGVQLTPAGEVIFRDGRFLADYAQRSLASARAAADGAGRMFCVGTSLLNPAKPFMDLWYRVNRDFPEYKLHLVPFEDDHRGILNEIGRLGEKFDFLVGVCDSRMWLDRCRFLQMGRYKKMVAVRRGHPLAAKGRLTPADLEGHTLMMVQAGDSPTNDRIRTALQREHPAIRLEDTAHFYDMSVFNRCAESDRLLLTLECWRDVHPGLVTLPVDWDFSIPYGLLYAKQPAPDVQRFVEAVQRELSAFPGK